tara:strand:+ start:61 stop:366 length:306 start_codon:yes stop_codon:yes gene_type:complete
MRSYKIELITNRLIDSVWTITAKIDEETGTAVILDYSRQNESGYDRENDLRNGDLVENDERIVQKLNIVADGTWADKEVIKIYEVLNKKHIFDYEDQCLTS